MAVGIDIVNIENFKSQLQQPGTTFLNVFTARELCDSSIYGGENALLEINNDCAETLAGKWAAKEAFIKAWSSLLIGEPPAVDPSSPAVFSQIEIFKDVWNRPLIELHSDVKEKFNERFSDLKISISISHDADIAAAFCIISETR